MKEIGSEFWDVPVQDNGNTNELFSESTQWFLSGRSALQAIIEDLRGCRTVAIPSWCCDSIVKPFIDCGFKVFFYPVYYDENGFHQDLLYDCDVLFIIDYFGYSLGEPSIKDYKGIVIRDITHSLFKNKHSFCDYYFGSLRKWCGVWTGGFAWANDGHMLLNRETCKEYIELRQNAMVYKSDYISDSTIDSINVKEHFLDLYGKAEQLLESVGVARAAYRDIDLANRLDVSFIKAKRRNNAKIIMDSLKEWLLFPIMGEEDCPLFVPVIVPNDNRNELQKYLIEKSIYCPIHWPISRNHICYKIESNLYKNILSIVCDQRYDEKDMETITSAINSFGDK